MGDFVAPKLLGVALASVHDSAQHVLGTRVTDQAGREYVYVVASGAVAVGDAVSLATGYVVAETTSGDAVFGVSQAAFADGEYGFVLVRGEGDASVPAGAAGTTFGRSTGATAGQLVASGDTGLAQSLFALQLGAVSGGLASVYIF